MRRHAGYAKSVVAAALVLLAVTAWCEEPDATTVPLTYKSTALFASVFGRAPSTNASLYRDPPDKPAAEAVCFSHRPRYGSIRLGNGKDTSFLFLLDESSGTGTGYDVLYVDANNNEDLTDDPALQGQRRKDAEGFTFPTVELAMPCGEETLPYHVTMHTDAVQPKEIAIEAAGYCEGTLSVGKAEFRIVLIDDNVNGLYADARETGMARHYPPRGTDLFVVDVNGDGAVSLSEGNAAEVHTVGVHVALGGDWYTVTPAADGRSLTFAQPAQECGSLLVKAEGFSGEISGPAGVVKVRGEESVRLPAGQYEFLSSQFDARDEDGRPWRIARIRAFSKKVFTIEPGRETAFAVGPPLEASIEVNQKTSTLFEFSLTITGVGAEEYSARDIQPVDGEDAAPAIYKVVSKKGDVIANGAFRYG